MTTAMPSAAIRVSRPIASPSGPRNSAIRARNARIGGKPDFVKDAMVTLKPLPPNHPSVFCAPCGNITTARVSLRMSGTTPPFVATSQRSEEHTSELQSRLHLVCRLLLEKKKKKQCDATDALNPSFSRLLYAHLR